MIELAIILTFVLLLIFGMIDFGNTFSNFQNLRQGVREAAREAANNPTQFTTQASPSTAFYNFIVDRTGLSANQLTVTWSTTGTISGGNWTSIAGGTNITVCVKFTVNSITGFAKPFLPSKLTSSVVMRFEPPTSTFPMPAAPAAATCT